MLKLMLLFVFVFVFVFMFMFMFMIMFMFRFMFTFMHMYMLHVFMFMFMLMLMLSHVIPYAKHPLEIPPFKCFFSCRTNNNSTSMSNTHYTHTAAPVLGLSTTPYLGPRAVALGGGGEFRPVI